MKTATLNIFFGEMGAGKTYTSNQVLTEMKEAGFDVVSISFAQPLKEYARRMGFIKKYTDIDELRNAVSYAINAETIINELIDSANTHNYIDREYLKLPVARLTELQKEQERLLQSDISETEIKKRHSNIVREAMQLIGTEIGRDTISVDIWASMLITRLEKIKVALPNSHIFIDDVRFEDELMAIMDISHKFKQINISYVMADINTRKRRLGMKEFNEIIMNHDSEKNCIKLVNIASFFTKEKKNISFGIIQND